MPQGTDLGCDELPETPSGKLLLRELRADAVTAAGHTLGHTHGPQ